MRVRTRLRIMIRASDVRRVRVRVRDAFTQGVTPQEAGGEEETLARAIVDHNIPLYTAHGRQRPPLRPLPTPRLTCRADG